MGDIEILNQRLQLWYRQVGILLKSNYIGIEPKTVEHIPVPIEQAIRLIAALPEIEGPLCATALQNCCQGENPFYDGDKFKSKLALFDQTACEFFTIVLKTKDQSGLLSLSSETYKLFREYAEDLVRMEHKDLIEHWALFQREFNTLHLYQFIKQWNIHKQHCPSMILKAIEDRIVIKVKKDEAELEIANLKGYDFVGFLQATLDRGLGQVMAQKDDLAIAVNECTDIRVKTTFEYFKKKPQLNKPFNQTEPSVSLGRVLTMYLGLITTHGQLMQNSEALLKGFGNIMSILLTTTSITQILERNLFCILHPKHWDNVLIVHGAISKMKKIYRDQNKSEMAVISLFIKYNEQNKTRDYIRIRSDMADITDLMKTNKTSFIKHLEYIPLSCCVDEKNPVYKPATAIQASRISLFNLCSTGVTIEQLMAFADDDSTDDHSNFDDMVKSMCCCINNIKDHKAVSLDDHVTALKSDCYAGIEKEVWRLGLLGVPFKSPTEKYWKDIKTLAKSLKKA